MQHFAVSHYYSYTTTTNTASLRSQTTIVYTLKGLVTKLTKIRICTKHRTVDTAVYNKLQNHYK